MRTVPAIRNLRAKRKADEADCCLGGLEGFLWEVALSLRSSRQEVGMCMCKYVWGRHVCTGMCVCRHVCRSHRCVGMCVQACVAQACVCAGMRVGGTHV